MQWVCIQREYLALARYFNVSFNALILCRCLDSMALSCFSERASYLGNNFLYSGSSSDDALFQLSKVDLCAKRKKVLRGSWQRAMRENCCLRQSKVNSGELFDEKETLKVMKSLIYKRPFGWQFWVLEHLTPLRPTISIKVFDTWQNLIPAALS